MEAGIMVRWEQLLDSSLAILLLVIILSACRENHNAPWQYLNEEGLTIASSRGILYVSDTAFSGTLYRLYPNSTDTLSIRRFWQGKPDGIWKQFYPGHQLMEVRYFEQGKKEGDHIGYWENGITKFYYELQNDVYHGNNKEWMPDGQLIADQHYQFGQEEGTQQVWYPNGKIKANYVIRNGRRYGLLGTKNCINVSDSVFIR